jgi:hypothetical protein
MAEVKVVSPKVTITQEKSSYRPGLNWNEKTEAVFDAVDGLRAALRDCQALPHDPNFEES